MPGFYPRPTMNLKLGDWFELPEDGIAGYITELYADEGGEFLSAVVAAVNGTFAAVDLTGVETQAVTLH